MRYLAIGFWFEDQDFSYSLDTDSDDPIEVSDLLTHKSQFHSKDYLAVVLLVENRDDSPPRVAKFWRGENGDFEPPPKQVH